MIRVSARSPPSSRRSPVDRARSTTTRRTRPIPDRADRRPTTAPSSDAPADRRVAPTLPAISEPELLVDIPIGQVVNVDANKPVARLRRLRRRRPDRHRAVVGRGYPTVYGEPFEPLEGGVYAGYPERQTTCPAAARTRRRTRTSTSTSPSTAISTDFMVYDDGDDSLLAPLAAEFGPAVMGIVLAHEYGHAIQSRVGALDQFLATIYTEQQADCFAGAWAGQAYRGESPLLRLGDADVRAGLIAMLEVRDPVGTDQFVAGGHGSAFDRVGAFQEGFVNGAQRCSELLDEPLTLMPNEFQSQRGLGARGQRVRTTAATTSATDEASHLPAARVPRRRSQPLLGDRARRRLPALLTESHDVRRRQLRLLRRRAPGERGAALPVAERGRLRRARRARPLPRVRRLHARLLLRDRLGGAGPGARGQPAAGRAAGVARRLLHGRLGARHHARSDSTGRPTRTGDRDGDGSRRHRHAAHPATSTRRSGWRSCSATQVANVNQVGSPFEKIESFRAGVLGGLDACNSRFGV